MATISMKSLLEAGVHFGHQKRRWNPKMKKYIFTARNGIHIIDLKKTIVLAKEAYEAMRDLAASGGKILFVGTKKQAQADIRSAAEKTGMFFINNRWLGGLLTNFQTVKKSIQRLRMLEEAFENDTVHTLAKTKKEILKLRREKERLSRYLEGIRNMNELPDALFVIDPKREEIAVREANRLGIPVFALVDTNCDPDLIQYPIPGNDDAIRAISLFLDIMTNAILEGKGGENVTELEVDESDAEMDTVIQKMDTLEEIEQKYDADLA